jgi:hypothetical protein
VRLVVLNAGVAALAIGLPIRRGLLVAGGVTLEALGLGITAARLGTAVVMGVRRPQT